MIRGWGGLLEGGRGGGALIEDFWYLHLSVFSHPQGFRSYNYFLMSNKMNFPPLK